MGLMSRFPSSSLLPSDRLRVGECIIDIPLREVRAPAARRPQRITPKSMSVLLVLVRNAGRVVARDSLLAEVWPETLPTNDVVTQAITLLRKAFAEERGTPQYIETIAKGGYRLLAPVQWLELSPDPASAVIVEVAAGPVPAVPLRDELLGMAPKRPRWRRGALFAGPAAVLLLGGGAAFLLIRGAQEDQPSFKGAMPIQTPELPYRLITSTLGLEIDPTLSPDASLVAYAASQPGRSGTVIKVQTTNQTPPRQVTFPQTGMSDRNPAWSPDGRRIALIRVGPENECRIIVIPAGGGAERVVGDCTGSDMLGFSWTRDGRGLLFGSMTTNHGHTGLRVLELASGNWRALEYNSTHTDLDYLPRYSPDGEWIVFVRNPQFGGLWRIPASGGTAEQLTTRSAEIHGWDWLPSGQALVFGRRIGSETRLYRLDLATRELSDFGIGDAQMPVVSQREGKLAFVRSRPQFGIYRINYGNAEATTLLVERLFISTGSDTQPAISPDATQLVFNSDRSGRYSLWWTDLGDPASLREVDGIQPDMRRLAEWSWDNRHVMVIGSDDSSQSGVYEVAAESGQVSRLPVPEGEPIQALYLPDPRRVLIGARGKDGRPRLILFDRSRSPWLELASIDGVSQAKVDPVRKRVMFTRLSDDGLWQADFGLKEANVHQIDMEAPTRSRYRTWDVAEDGAIAFIDSTVDCETRIRRIADPGRERVLCLLKDRLASSNGFSVSTRANALFLPIASQDGADIAFMTLPSDPKAGGQGWVK